MDLSMYGAQQDYAEEKKAELEEKVPQYPHTGPLGSVGQSCPIDVDELSNRLNLPDSALVYMFREDEIGRYQESSTMSKKSASRPQTASLK